MWLETFCVCAPLRAGGESIGLSCILLTFKSRHATLLGSLHDYLFKDAAFYDIKQQREIYISFEMRRLRKKTGQMWISKLIILKTYSGIVLRCTERPEITDLNTPLDAHTVMLAMLWKTNCIHQQLLHLLWILFLSGINTLERAGGKLCDGLRKKYVGW